MSHVSEPIFVPDEPRDEPRDEPYEEIHHPAHYNQLEIECIDVVQHFSFTLGSAIKSLWRAGLKPGAATLDDLRKARWYIDHEIQRVERAQYAASRR